MLNLKNNNEALKSVAARVRSAIDLIESGRVMEGRTALERLIRVLPRPSERHLHAAKTITRGETDES